MIKKDNSESKRYGYYGMNGVYYVYDHKNHNIPIGYGNKEFTSKRACLKEVDKLNK